MSKTFNLGNENLWLFVKFSAHTPTKKSNFQYPVSHLFGKKTVCKIRECCTWTEKKKNLSTHVVETVWKMCRNWETKLDIMVLNST